MAEKRSRSVGDVLSDTQTRVTDDLMQTNKACRLVGIPFRQEIIHTGRESNFNVSISRGRLPKIILKISFPQRIHANCRQEVHNILSKMNCTVSLPTSVKLITWRPWLPTIWKAS